MPRSLLRILLPLIILFAAVLLLIHTQSDDIHKLLGLLLPADCPAPCLIGIRPGVTTVEEAVKILEESEWVTNIQPKYTEFDRSEQNLSWGFIYWDWKDNAPFWKDHNPRHQFGISPGSMQIVSGIVSEVTVSTSFTVGSIQVGLGNPVFYRTSTSIGLGVFCTPSPCPPTLKLRRPLQHEFYYPFNAMVVGSSGNCPSTEPDWNAQVFMVVKDSKEFDRVLEWFMNTRNPMETERQLIHLYCQE